MTKKEFLESCKHLFKQEDIKKFLEKLTEEYKIGTYYGIWVFADQYYIQSDGKGLYQLQIANCYYENKDLEPLEDILWDWAKEELN